MSIVSVDESSISSSSFNDNSLHEAIAGHQSWRLGFTLNEQISIKDLIKELSSNTKMFPRFSPEGEFSFTTLKNVYNYTDITHTIKSKDVINYSFETSNTNDIYNSHEISFEYDYGAEEYKKISKKNLFVTDSLGDFKGYDEITNYLYNGSGNENWEYDISDIYNKVEEDSINYVEAKYIRSSHTVELFKKFLLMEYINEHLIVKLSLNSSYSDVEIGDIIYIDKLSDKKALGYKYWSYEVKGGQLLYPFYIVTEVIKKSGKIDLTVQRLHRLEYGLPLWLIDNTISDPNYILPDNAVSISEVVDDGRVYTKIGTDVTSQIQPIYEDYSPNLYNEFLLQWFPDENSNHLNFEANSVIRLDVVQSKLYDVDTQNWSVELSEYIDGEWTDYMFETNNFSFSDYSNPETNYSGHVIIKAKNTNTTGEIIIGRLKITTDEGTTYHKQFVQDIETDDDFILGDVNGDGIVNVLDAVKTVQYILGLEEFTADQIIAGDINQDGGINILDIVQIINIILDT